MHENMHNLLMLQDDLHMTLTKYFEYPIQYSGQFLMEDEISNDAKDSHEDNWVEDDT